MKEMIEENALRVFRNIKTPFYYYDIDLLRRTLDTYVSECDRYGYKPHYALKANSDPRLVHEIVRAGLGADCVSGNEVKFAAEQGFAPDSIVFAGVGKTDDEIRDALEIGIHSFNCESIQELEVIDEIAGEMGMIAPVTLRINPDVDAHTHRYITTGTLHDKFGIHETSFPEVFEILRSAANLEFVGLHFHIGSQITDMGVYKCLCEKVTDIQNVFTANGFEVRDLNLGGGLGVDYEDPQRHPMAPFHDYIETIHEHLPLQAGQTVHLENGRALVAQCGTLISRVLFVKPSEGINFLILDAGMNDLIRPALYSAHHHLDNLDARFRTASLTSADVAPVIPGVPSAAPSAGSKSGNVLYDVVGPVCESSDTWGRNVSLPLSKRGDLVAIRSAGAYGQAMAMTYNMKPLAEAYYSDELLSLRSLAGLTQTGDVPYVGVG